MFLKQSTAVVIPLGPFVDKTDGVTLETGLVTALDHASTGILLSKNGGTLTIRHATVTASSYDAHGCYKVTLDATDTNTLGQLRAIYTDAATCLPVWVDFMVLPAMIYDSLVAGSDRLDTNVTHIADTSQTGRDIGASVLLSSGTGTGQLKLASGYVAMTWADIAAPTTTVNLSGTTIGVLSALAADSVSASALATDAVQEIRNAITGGAYALSTDSNGRVRIVDGTSAGELDTLSGTVLLRSATQASIDAIEADTNELQTDWANGGRLDNILDARASQTSVDDLPTNAELATALGTADDAVLAAIADLNDLLTDTRAEPGQGAPPATTDPLTKLDYLYKWRRNKMDNNGSENKFYADDGTTVDHKQSTTSAAGTVTVGEMATGA